MKRMALVVAGLGALTLLAAGVAGAQMMGGSGDAGMRMGQGMETMNSATRERRRDFWRGDAARTYRGMRNPLPLDAKTLALGRTVYEENCAACHGASGRGDGEAGRDLNPRPVDLTRMTYRQGRMAGLIFYAVSEGGEPYGSAMPAFKDTLSETERWAVVAYVRRSLGK